MTFEAEIEKKMITKLNTYQYIIDNDIQVVRFGAIREALKINKPFLAVTCEPRTNINGPLWNADINLDVLVPHTADADSVVIDALNGLSGDLIDDIKTTPSILSNTGYTVDGLINIRESPRPEIAQTLRAAFRTARLFISYQKQ